MRPRPRDRGDDTGNMKATAMEAAAAAIGPPSVRPKNAARIFPGMGKSLLTRNLVTVQVSFSHGNLELYLLQLHLPL